MTTILEIIDTAVKVGLGASISAMASWLLASQNAMNRRTDTKIENMREIIKEFSIKTESITASMDLAGHAYFSKNYTEAREHSITACRE